MTSSLVYKNIGIPKEIKKQEYRVAITPKQVNYLKTIGTNILIEKNAGLGCGFTNEDYKKSGAIICDNSNSIYSNCDMIVKIKEPQENEYDLIHKDQVLFTYFHFASSKQLTDAMINNKSICIAYETIKNDNNSLPLLAPMSEIAGLLSIQQGMKYLEKSYGGNGTLLCGTSTEPPGTITIIGGGIAGTAAAKLAANIGANVYIIEKNVTKVIELSYKFKNYKNVEIINSSNISDLKNYLNISDIIIGAILIPNGDKAPKIITKEMIKDFKSGSVFIDISIDQGGITEVSKPTSHDNPIFKYENTVFYCVANIPGITPLTSTNAITNVTFPYIEELLKFGWKKASIMNNDILNGINIANGHLTNKALATLYNYEYTDIHNLLKI